MRKNVVNVEQIATDETEIELLNYLKTYVVKNGLIELKKKLTETVDIRCNLLKKENIEIKSVFPFYFVEPRLVRELVNFKLLYHITY